MKEVDCDSKKVEPSVRHEVIKFKPCIVVFTGPGFTGKTTLGHLLSERTNFVFYDVDETRWSIFDKNPDQDFPDVLPDQMERFAMLTSYQANHERARNAIWAGKPVILAATYSRETYHEMLKSLQQEMGIPMKVFLLEASDKEIEIRIQKRLREGSFSNVRTMEHYLRMKNRQEITGVDLVIVNTEKPLDQTVSEIFSYLKPLQY